MKNDVVIIAFLLKNSLALAKLFAYAVDESGNVVLPVRKGS